MGMIMVTSPSTKMSRESRASLLLILVVDSNLPIQLLSLNRVVQQLQGVLGQDKGATLVCGVDEIMVQLIRVVRKGHLPAVGKCKCLSALIFAHLGEIEPVPAHVQHAPRPQAVLACLLIMASATATAAAGVAEICTPLMQPSITGGGGGGVGWGLGKMGWDGVGLGGRWGGWRLTTLASCLTSWVVAYCQGTQQFKVKTCLRADRTPAELKEEQKDPGVRP